MGDLGSNSGSGRSPGEGNGNPLQYSCLENPMDREAWWATVHVVAKSRTLQSDFTFTFFQYVFLNQFLINIYVDIYLIYVYIFKIVHLSILTSFSSQLRSHPSSPGQCRGGPAKCCGEGQECWALHPFAPYCLREGAEPFSSVLTQAYQA